MAKRQQRQGIPTELSVAQFEQFVLPHLTVGKGSAITQIKLHSRLALDFNKIRM